MNLATWRNDAYVRERFPVLEIDELAAGLAAVVASSSPAPVRWGLRRLGFERAARP